MHIMDDSVSGSANAISPHHTESSDRYKNAMFLGAPTRIFVIEAKITRI